MSNLPQTSLGRYQYTALDKLSTCTLGAQPGSQRFYLGKRLSTEIQGDVEHSIMQHEEQLLAQQQRQADTLLTHLLATDQQRSVLALLGASRPKHLAYSPYGHRAPENGLLSLLGFNGERPDPVTGHYLLGNGYRAFNPVLMRFNNPDTLSPFGVGGVNAYTYCSGDPVNFSDPTGHVGSTLLGSLSGMRARRQSMEWHLPSHTTPRGMDKTLIASINRNQPSMKRISSSADNAINHAKLLKYQSKEVDELISTKKHLHNYKTNRKEIIKEIQNDISYDSNESGPGLIQISRTRYDETLERQALLTLQKTYELNKKLVEHLGLSATHIRTGPSVKR